MTSPSLDKRGQPTEAPPQPLRTPLLRLEQLAAAQRVREAWLARQLPVAAGPSEARPPEPGAG